MLSSVSCRGEESEKHRLETPFGTLRLLLWPYRSIRVVTLTAATYTIVPAPMVERL